MAPKQVFTGFETQTSLGPILVFALLLTLVAMYLKSRLASILHLISTVALAFAAAATASLLSSGDLSSVESAIEKSTGIAGWQSQRETVVTSVEASVWVYGSLVMLCLLVVLMGWLAYDSAKGGNMRSIQRSKTASSQTDNLGALWSETTN